MPYHNKKIDQQPESHDITLDIPTSLRSEITTSVTNPHNTWRDTCGICDTFATETRQHPLQWPGERDSTRTPAHAEALVSICSAEKSSKNELVDVWTQPKSSACISSCTISSSANHCGNHSNGKGDDAIIPLRSRIP